MVDIPNMYSQVVHKRNHSVKYRNRQESLHFFPYSESLSIFDPQFFFLSSFSLPSLSFNFETNHLRVISNIFSASFEHARTPVS